MKFITIYIYGHCADRLNRFGTFENVEVVPLFLKTLEFPYTPRTKNSQLLISLKNQFEC